MAQETATLDIDKVKVGDASTLMPDITVDTATTDGATEDETTYQNSNYSQQFGYYKNQADVKAAIDTRAVWTVGKKWTTLDNRTEVTLNRMRGWGEDTFQTILLNMHIVKRIGGDSFSEIINNDKGTLINLKPLDPSVMRIVSKKGILVRYEQVLKGGGVKKFQPHQILHLMNKRVADEIHGTSDIDVLEPIILASNEVFVDTKKMYHRYVKPIMKWELDTDDETKINTFMVKRETAREATEDIYIPKDTVTHELVTVPSSATLSPFQWLEYLNNKFYQVVGIPQIILGNAAEFSESSAKIAYMSFQQSVEFEQLDTETQIFNQLGFRIELEFPATITNELISDKQKDGANAQVGFQPSDTTLTAEQQEGAQ